MSENRQGERICATEEKTEQNVYLKKRRKEAVKNVILE